MKKITALLMSLALTLAVAAPSFAVPLIDFASVATSIQGELTTAATAIMTVAVLILAARVGWKFVKRFTA